MELAAKARAAAAAERARARVTEQREAARLAAEHGIARDMILLVVPNGFVTESRKLKCTATDLADLVKQVQQSLGLPAESYMSHVVADGDIPVALERLDQLLDKAKVQMWPQEPTSRKMILFVMPNGFVKESRKLKLKATGGSRTENQNCRTV